ncbi:MAG: addiction module killer protein [Gammaproteobacteria bacterium]|jgi:putative addiction module killer protein|nr:addiction module killer protein [Gammaproteobacteria bacterium]
MEVTRFKEIYLYKAKNNKVPFIEWLEALDKKVRYRIKERLDRITLGNLGDYKVIEAGVCELRLAFGPGYRIYFGQEQSTIVILLCGGDKSNQNKDIKKAVRYWQDYLARTEHGK